MYSIDHWLDNGTLQSGFLRKRRTSWQTAKTCADVISTAETIGGWDSWKTLTFRITTSFPHRKLLFNAVQPYVTITTELVSWEKLAEEASYKVKCISWIQFSCRSDCLNFFLFSFFMYTEFNVAVFITNQVCSHELTHSLFRNTLNCLLLRKADDLLWPWR